MSPPDLGAVLVATVAQAVREAIQPLVAELADLRRTFDERVPPKWLTRMEAAALEQCSVDTIDRQVACGRLRSRRVGRRIRIDPASLSPPSDLEVAAMVREVRRAR